jgi:hypothetical protein
MRAQLEKVVKIKNPRDRGNALTEVGPERWHGDDRGGRRLHAVWGGDSRVDVL